MHVHPPPPQPERLVMRKDEAVGNKKKCKNGVRSDIRGKIGQKIFFFKTSQLLSCLSFWSFKN
jgi:hypothetical protein